MARELRNVERVIVCGEEGGKKAVTSDVFAGKPVSPISIVGSLLMV